MLKDATASSCFTIAVVIPTSHPLACVPSDPFDFSVAAQNSGASKQPRACAADSRRARQLHAFFCLKTRNAHLPFKQDHIARHTRRATFGRIAADADRA
ncbi:hypothetical protein [Burkholderia ubonensis]|uniref:hypothetical protein n=1 Tax=Burkholderia ubonensis TaxID=101571 RepID=UPI0018DF1BFD|nr:hypothetical protein [Burkholderia ubonensis]